MKYTISRTSNWDDAVAPCKEAIKETCVRVDERTVNDPSKISCFKGNNDWYDKGTNHRVENGHIMRDFPHEDWFVEVNDIMKFGEKYGTLILNVHSGCIYAKGFPHIEIYDDYRE